MEATRQVGSKGAGRASGALSCSMSIGWGGRDRTYECRNQNPVPYHLATPQRKPCLRAGDAAAGPCVPRSRSRTRFRKPETQPSPTERYRAKPASGCRASVATTRPAMSSGNAFTARRAASCVSQAAITRRTRAGHSRVRNDSGKRRKRAGHFGIPRNRAPARDRYGRNSRKRRSFSPTWCIVSIRGLRKCAQSGRAPQASRVQAIAGAAKPAARARRCPRTNAFSPCTKNGTSAPSGSAKRRELAAGKLESPEAIEAEQHARSIGASAAQACAERNALVDADRHTFARPGRQLQQPRCTDREVVLRRHADNVVAFVDHAVGERSSVTVSAKSISANSDSMQVIAIGTPTGHVQEQVDLRRCSDASACAPLRPSGRVAPRIQHEAQLGVRIGETKARGPVAALAVAVDDLPTVLPQHRRACRRSRARSCADSPDAVRRAPTTRVRAAGIGAPNTLDVSASQSRALRHAPVGQLETNLARRALEARQRRPERRRERQLVAIGAMDPAKVRRGGLAAMPRRKSPRDFERRVRDATRMRWSCEPAARLHTPRAEQR